MNHVICMDDVNSCNKAANDGRYNVGLSVALAYRLYR